MTASGIPEIELVGKPGTTSRSGPMRRRRPMTPMSSSTGIVLAERIPRAHPTRGTGGRRARLRLGQASSSEAHTNAEERQSLEP
jgi:hypothetical protein